MTRSRQYSWARVAEHKYEAQISGSGETVQSCKTSDSVGSGDHLLAVFSFSSAFSFPLSQWLIEPVHSTNSVLAQY